MPHFKCSKCHHEFEGLRDDSECDWCGADGYILEEQTPLEKMVREVSKIGVDKFLRSCNSD